MLSKTASSAIVLNSSRSRSSSRCRRWLVEASRRQVTTSGPGKWAWASRQARDTQRDPERHEASQASFEQICEGRLADLKLWRSVESIKRLGHRLAQVDPLRLQQPEQLKELDWPGHKLVEQLRTRGDIVATRGFLETKQPLMAVNELLEAVWSIYVGGQCGLEFEQVSSQEEREWLTRQWEQLNEMAHLSELEQQNLAKLLLECETFDHFMASKYPSTKRYGCEGAEPMLVVFDEILRLCHLGESEADEMTKSIGQIDDLIIGMPHRGRLNLLACLLGMGPRVIFNKCRGEPELDLREAWMATGDVLSHLSLNARFVYGLDRQHFGLWRDTPEPINVSLLPNPSHLELSSPMVVGAARGRAHNKLHGYSSSPKFPSGNQAEELAAGDEHYSRFFPSILPIQVHGDAALAGQGIVQETLQMSQLPKFNVGGSIHLVINNQIGYTTEAGEGRSARQATDILKLIGAPIVHVNGENIGALVRATRLALTYRQRFQKDVAIELVCYRQHGHNELDEPSFTQPLMYSAIRRRPSIPQTFCDQIGMAPERRQQIVEFFKAKLQAAHKSVDVFKPDNDNYRNFALPTEYHRDHISCWQSGCDLNLLREVGLATVHTPADFRLHPTLKRVLQDERRAKLAHVDGSNLGQVKVDWALAELMAFGSLLKQNQSVRLAGQDVARGTFSTRHAVVYDQNTGRPYVPLNAMAQSQAAKLEVANTVLSEEAALAYEFAYSMETCSLTCWEAQFGDFFNTAQSVVDTLVSSSEIKWLRQSPLTMLLPHGLDGAGPEHSSGRLERFLQLSSSSQSSVDTEAKVNWSICFPTQPSQYFHLLRRQVLRPFRKPLVVMAPKLIFRHPDCVSSLDQLGPEGSFEPVLDDPDTQQQQQQAKQLVDTLLLCSGKLYFQLRQLKLREKLQNVAIVRIEELCPFPVQSIVRTIQQYRKVKPERIAWVQEEHKNQGAYNYVQDRLSNMANLKLHYFGRQESEMPAAGSTSIHKRQMGQVLHQLHQWIVQK